MTGPFRVLVLLLAIATTGCVQIPYKPSASVNHVAITPEEAAAITLSSPRHSAFIEAVAKSAQHVEPRITVVDATAYLAPTSGQALLTAFLEPQQSGGTAPPADYVLCVGQPVHRQLHDTGAAAPFIYFPVIWVGYEKVQSRESVVASLIDVRAHAAEHLEVSSTYSETIAAMVYGIATIARPQAALRDALATDVAHRLAGLQPDGPIRIMVLAEEGGTTEAPPADGAGAAQQMAGAQAPVSQ